jgi:hypothetical protein
MVTFIGIVTRSGLRIKAGLISLKLLIANAAVAGYLKTGTPPAVVVRRARLETAYVAGAVVREGSLEGTRVDVLGRRGGVHVLGAGVYVPGRRGSVHIPTVGRIVRAVSACPWGASRHASAAHNTTQHSIPRWYWASNLADPMETFPRRRSVYAALTSRSVDGVYRAHPKNAPVVFSPPSA